MDDKELIAKKIDPPKWAIEGIVPEGCTLFAAPHKIGKSFFVLGMAADVAYGDSFLDTYPTNPGHVLFMGLEDSFWRLQVRLGMLLAVREREPNGMLHIETEWPRAEEGGIAHIENWLSDFPESQRRLVVIDVLRRFDSIRGYSTEQDYAKIAELSDLGKRKHVAIIAVHHTNRFGARNKDWTERTQGTMGVNAAADCLMTLERERERSNAILRFTGKDVHEESVPLVFDSQKGIWKIRETENGEVPASENVIVPLSPERKEIYRTVAENPGLQARSIAEKLGRPYDSLRMLLWKMKSDSLVVIDGKYYTKDSARNLSDTAQLSIVVPPTHAEEVEQWRRDQIRKARKVNGR